MSLIRCKHKDDLGICSKFNTACSSKSAECPIQLRHQIEALQHQLSRFHHCWVWQEPEDRDFLSMMNPDMDILIPAGLLQSLLPITASTAEHLKGGKSS